MVEEKQLTTKDSQNKSLSETKPVKKTFFSSIIISVALRVKARLHTRHIYLYFFVNKLKLNQQSAIGPFLIPDFSDELPHLLLRRMQNRWYFSIPIYTKKSIFYVLNFKYSLYTYYLILEQKKHKKLHWKSCDFDFL
jgi:hypothetical protein